MAFEIHDGDNKAIGINQLDAEAAAFWNKEVHEKNYATPYTKAEGLSAKELVDFYMKNNNWFDKIGWHISEGADNWESVRIAVMNPTLIDNFGREIMEELYRPYINLINHWESKGYKPVPVKD